MADRGHFDALVLSYRQACEDWGSGHESALTRIDAAEEALVALIECDCAATPTSPPPLPEGCRLLSARTSTRIVATREEVGVGLWSDGGITITYAGGDDQAIQIGELQAILAYLAALPPESGGA